MDRERILIDTSILIDHLRGEHKERSAFYRATRRFECAISAIAEFEFRVGMTPTNHEFIEQLLALTPVLPFDSACVRVASETFRTLRATNRLIDLPDLFIASTAIAYDMPLLTLNQAHFGRVQQLSLLEPSTL